MSRISFLLILLTALSLQVLLANSLPVRIDLLLIVLIVYCIEKNTIESIFMGTALGLVQDTLTGGIFGIRAFSKTVTAYLLSMAGKKIVAENPYIQFITAAGATIIDLFIAGEIERILTQAPYRVFDKAGLAGIAINAFICCTVYHGINYFRLRKKL